MKKHNLITGLLFLASVVFAPQAFAQDWIAATKVVASTNTDADSPAPQAVDGQTGTGWKLASGATAGWLELDWATPQLIAGVDWQGNLRSGTSAQLWYQQNGSWKPFLAGTLDSSSPVGWVDLSLDEAVATGLQWRVSGLDASADRLNELQVKGQNLAALVRKLTPSGVSASDNTLWSQDEVNLIDGDTRTSWRLDGGASDDADDKDTRDWLKTHVNRKHFAATWGEGAAIVEYPQSVALDLVKVYLPLALESDVTVEALVGTSWTRLGVLPRGTAAGWQRLGVNSLGVSTTQVRLRASVGVWGAAQVGEVEVWGRSSQAGRTPQSLLTSGAVDLSNPVNLSFASDGTTAEKLLFVVRGAATSLTVELNGKPVTAVKALSLRGRDVYALSLTDGQLWTGDNFVRVSAAGSATLEDVQEAKVVADGRVAVGPAGWGDGLLYTSASNPEGTSVLALGGQVSLERLEITAVEASSVSAWAWVGGTWQALTTPLALGGLVTDQIKLSAVGKSAEVRVWGSRVSAAGPLVRVISPIEETGSDGSDLGSKLVGWVTSGATKVTVNGLIAKLKGNIFWVKIADLKLVDGEENLVTIVATDAQARQGSKVVHLVTAVSDKLTLDQPDVTVYTKAASFTISGKVTASNGSVTVDGTEVSVTSKKFTSNVSLDEGLNLISIQWKKTNGKLISNLLRRVVRISRGVSVSIDSPADGALVAKPTVDIAGRVRGVGDVTVTVNSVNAPVAGGMFALTGVALTEGVNTLVVKAVDSTGQSATVNLKVVRDTTAPVIAVVQPQDGSYAVTTLVPVSLQVSDASAAWVKINTGDWMPVVGGVASTTVPLSEGPQTLNITAIDAAGNQSSAAIHLIVDVSLPLAFSVTATPSGWTSNPRPSVSFGTTDAISGIDHYSVAVDTRDPVTAVSPYTLPTLADGTHLVVVTAFNRAGLSTSSSTQVYIDTTPPPTVANFDAIPGKDSIALNWGVGESGETYRVERNPAWSGRTKTLTATSLDDTGLTFGTTYSYRIWAVDKAGNIGSASAWTPVKVGFEIQNVVADTPSVAEYQNVEVNIPAGALAPEVSKVMINELGFDALVNQPANPPVSPIYQVTVSQVQNGVETPAEHADLQAPVKVDLTYDPQNIPAGYSEANLKAFYFDSLWGRWIPVDGSSVDPLAHVVSFETNHFTDFSVQATQAADLSPQQIRDVQFSPFATKVQQGPVRVSGQGGSASTDFTELVLPGKNNFDLVLKRTWDSGTAQSDATTTNTTTVTDSNGNNPVTTTTSTTGNTTTTKVTQNGTTTTTITTTPSTDGDSPWHVGSGWRMNFPSLKWNGSGLWVKGPDGETLSLDQAQVDSQSLSADGNTKTVTLVTHENADLRVEVTFTVTPTYLFWVIPIGKSYSYQGATLIEKDGRTVEFDTLGRVLHMHDSTGLNSIDFNYSGATPVISDSLGRQITFTVDTKKNITGFTVAQSAGSSVKTTGPSYTISATGTLDTATDVGGRVWSYGYSLQTLNSTTVMQEAHPQGYQDPGPTVTVIQALASVSGPGVGVSTVDYTLKSLSYVMQSSGYNYKITNQRLVASTLKVGLISDAVLRSTSYDYTFADGGHEHQFYNSQSVVNDGRLTRTTSFDPIARDRAKLSNVPDALQRAATTEVVPQAGPTTVTDNTSGNIVETQSQNYDTLMRPTQTKTVRATNNYTQTDYVYDDWGNPTKVTSQSFVGARQTKKVQNLTYYAAGIYRDRVATSQTLISGWDNTGNPIADVEEKQAYTYTAKGQVLTSQTWTGSVWATTSYTYDAATGQVDTITAPAIGTPAASQVTQYTYDYTTHTGEYWVTATVKSVLPAVGGTARDLVTSSHYQTRTGNLVWSQDAKGFVTQRTYDELGRVKSITEPDDNDVVDANGNMTGRSDNPFTQVTYDDSLLTSEVATFAKVTDAGTASKFTSDVKYTFDALGRLVTVLKHNKDNTTAHTDHPVTTTLVYDAYDQVLYVRGPVTDADVGATPSRTLSTLFTGFTYDNQGRVTSIWAPGASKAKTLVYDDALNQVTTTDETSRVTVQTLGWDGKPLTQTVQGDHNIVSSTYYDGAGRVIAAVDPNGNTSTMTYNAQGLVAETALPARTVGNAQVTPKLTKTYDIVGNLYTTSQDLDGTTNKRTTTYTVNGIGQVLATSTPVTVTLNSVASAKTIVVKNTFDKNGNVTDQTSGYSDGDQLTTSWTYDSHNRVLTEKQQIATGEYRTTSYQYDTRGNRIQVKDPRADIAGLTGRFLLDLKYDQLNRLVEADLPSADGTTPTITFAYDGRGNLTQRTEPDGQSTTYTYSLRNQLKTQTLVKGTGGYTTTYDYDDAGRPTAVTAPNTTHVVHTEYDLAGRVYRQGSDDLGWTTVTSYDDNGNKLSVQDGRGNTTNYHYNVDGQPDSITDANLGVTSIAYDRWNQKLSVTDPELNVRNYTYDEIGRLVSEQTPWGAKITSAYDAWGDVEHVIDAMGTKFDRTYNGAHQLLTDQATSADGNTVQTNSYKYDQAGDLKEADTGVIDTFYNLNSSGTYVPNPYGQITGKSEAGILPTGSLAMSYGYDNNQRLTGVTNPDNSSASYHYNQQGQLDTMNGWVTGNLNYDTYGRLDNFTLANGLKKTLNYDAQDRLQKLDYSATNADVKDYAFTYDMAGNIATKNQNNYHYDAINQLIFADEKGWYQKKPDEIQPNYGVANRDYTGTTQLSFTVTPTQIVSLDMAKRSIEVDLGAVYGVNKIELHPNIPNHRVRERDLTVFGDNVKLSGWVFAENSDGSITLSFAKIVSLRKLRVHTIWDDRDISNQSLSTKATFTNTAQELVKVWALKTTHTEDYGYDKAGNRTRLTTDGEITTLSQYYQNNAYGNLSWLRTDGTWFYEYDNNGNQIIKAKALLGTDNTSAIDTTKEYWTYTWDLRNRLTSVSKNGVTVASYTYDADNLRVKRVSPTDTTVYAYGRSGALTYQKSLTTNTSRTFTYLQDQVVGWTDTAANGTKTVYYAVTDQLGSVTQIMDAGQKNGSGALVTGSAKIVWASEYDPFGKTAGVEGLYDFDGSYAGHQVDRDTGLIYMWNRWQDPDNGRFISEDPAQDGANFYAYVGNNPTGNVDPLGLALRQASGTGQWYDDEVPDTSNNSSGNSTGTTYTSQQQNTPSQEDILEQQKRAGAATTTTPDTSSTKNEGPGWGPSTQEHKGDTIVKDATDALLGFVKTNAIYPAIQGGADMALHSRNPVVSLWGAFQFTFWEAINIVTPDDFVDLQNDFALAESMNLQGFIGRKLAKDLEKVATKNGANVKVLNRMKNMGDLIRNPNVDCSDLASLLKKEAGGGKIVNFEMPGNSDLLNPKLNLRVPEDGNIVNYVYHQVFTDGSYIYDPRYSLEAVKFSDYIQMMKKLNPGVEVKIGEY